MYTYTILLTFLVLKIKFCIEKFDFSSPNLKLLIQVQVQCLGNLLQYIRAILLCMHLIFFLSCQMSGIQIQLHFIFLTRQLLVLEKLENTKMYFSFITEKCFEKFFSLLESDKDYHYMDYHRISIWVIILNRQYCMITYDNIDLPRV